MYLCFIISLTVSCSEAIFLAYISDMKWTLIRLIQYVLALRIHDIFNIVNFKKK